MNYLSDEFQKLLRESNKITGNEVAAKLGDIYLAINVLDGSKRTLSIDMALLESLKTNNIVNNNKKRVLKG